MFLANVRSHSRTKTFQSAWYGFSSSTEDVTSSPSLLRYPSLPIREKPLDEHHVDVVVTWHCESIDWLSEILPELSGQMTIILLHKVDESDLAKPECRPNIPETSLDIKYVRLPNIGRDTHSPFFYISNHYETLSRHTIFIQAGHHYTVSNSWMPSAQGYESNAEALNHFVRLALETDPTFLPIMPTLNGQPILFVDRDSNDNREEQDRDDPPTLKKFDACSHDIPNRVRETHRILFGASPCPMKTFPFVPGFQFGVRNDNIRSRPKSIWEAIEKLTYGGCSDIGYAVERLSINLFNSSEVVSPPDTWDVPLYCKDDERPYFDEPFDASVAHGFWSKYWKCSVDVHGGVSEKKRLGSPAHIPSVSCGGHVAKNCGECPSGNGESWCSGDCEWDASTNTCTDSPSRLHQAYTSLIKNRLFQPVADEHGEYVNVILVRSPFATKEQEDMYERYKDEILFLGIMSMEAYPLRSPNPHAQQFVPEDYISRFPG